MPTYVYSPVPTKRSNNQNTTTEKKSSKNYQINASRRSSNNQNLLDMFVQKQLKESYQKPYNVAAKTLKYRTSAPSFVGKRYTKQQNGGYTLEYNIKNAAIANNQKPKLKFIQVAKLISPKSLK